MAPNFEVQHLIISLIEFDGAKLLQVENLLSKPYDDPYENLKK